MSLAKVAVRGAAVLGVALVAAPFLLRRAVLHRSGRVFNSDGVDLHFTTMGQGSPVILLHGFAVNGDLNWRLPGLASKLAERHQVVILDLRGHGASDHPASFGIEMVDDVVHLIDHLGLDRAHVAGYSLGGVIALKMASTNPERMLSVAALGSGWENPETSMFLGAIDEIAGALEAGEGVGPLAEHLGGDRESPGLIHQAWVRFMTSFVNDGPALAGVVRQIPELVVEEGDLANIAIPVCSIVGESDPMRPGSEALSGRVQDLELVVIDGADHITAVGHPLMASTYLAFLDRAESAVASGDTTEAP